MSGPGLRVSAHGIEAELRYGVFFLPTQFARRTVLHRENVQPGTVVIPHSAASNRV
jgi:hypothetical protein